ncbi:hypothetical protein Fmac_018265 [Flemingia macrophylla]|uniref:Uncharacterized protein n=1 Tax=Flemingia macrophylla TaxID=520843 RepID=A0ABD1M4H6_9FABA
MIRWGINGIEYMLFGPNISAYNLDKKEAHNTDQVIATIFVDCINLLQVDTANLISPPEKRLVDVTANS